MLNYEQQLQQEIDKAQGYVTDKTSYINKFEETLVSEKDKLAILTENLNTLLEEQRKLQEFAEWKASAEKVSKTTKETGQKVGKTLKSVTTEVAKEEAEEK